VPALREQVRRNRERDEQRRSAMERRRPVSPRERRGRRRTDAWATRVCDDEKEKT